MVGCGGKFMVVMRESLMLLGSQLFANRLRASYEVR